MRPAHGVVVVRLRPAELFVPFHQEFRGLQGRQAVEVGHLVVGTIQRAFRRGAVIADDVIDERVVEDVELLQAVDQASDMVVGVLEEPRIDLHLAAQDRL